MNAPSRSFNWKSWQGCLFVSVVTAAVWWLCFQSPMFWVTSGMGEPNRPFIDLYGLLVASDAVRLGLDPFLPSPLDPYHRPHVYSEWWFAMGAMGLGRKDVLWFGTVLAASLIITAVAMVRPRNLRESFMLLCLLLSPAFLLAANRGNNDLIMLPLVSAGLLCFRRAGLGWRAIGIILFASTAVLKYYPLVTLVLLLDLRSRRDFRIGLGLYALVLLLAWPGLLSGLKSASLYAPEPVWLYAFGAPVLARDFELKQSILWLVPAALLVVWALAVAWRQRRQSVPARADESHQHERDFVCGAAMLVGLFFLGASFVYKLIFAVWLLPWLWERPLAAGEVRWRRIIWYLLLSVVWLEGTVALGFNLVARFRGQPGNVDLLKLTLLVEQLLTWALVACLARFLLIYLGQWGCSLLARTPDTAQRTPV